MVFAMYSSLAQQEGFIYGEVTLSNGDRHAGKIYWSAGQRMWVDILTVEKSDNPLLKYLNNEELRKLSEEEKEKQLDWGFMALWENNYPSRKLTLRCRFGDIAALNVTGDQEAVIVLKNGEEVNVYIDEDEEYRKQLGEKIIVYTSKKEKVGIEWEDLSHVRFMKTPTKLPQFTAIPLYGNVLTRGGLSYTGLVQWDMDEHLTSNYIDGKNNEDEKVRYRFKEIHSIRPKDNGALIKLHSGEEVFLHGRSNVGRQNDGIIIRHPTWGQVKIRWKDFKRVSFSPYPVNSSFGYDAFENAKELSGKIKTKDKKIWQGRLAFDLDEKLDIETVDGWDNAGALRQVPFSYIKKIYPISQSQSAIILKNGEKLILGGRSDVNEDNWGLMVGLKEGEFKYISWNKIDEILLD